MRTSFPKGSARPSELLVARARLMRFGATEAETRLWAELRGKRLGVSFRRQVPLLGRYIGDFVAQEARLVLEVDGGWHAGRERSDARRDEALRTAGYRVVRLPAELVLRDVPAAVARVVKALAASAGG